MHRFEKLVLALLLVLAGAFALAQEAQPAEPVTPAPETVEPEAEVPDVAWVRLAHFSPNAPELTVTFTPTNEETAAAFSGDQFPALNYQSFTEYIEVPTGNYTVSASGVEGTVESEFSFARGNYYTLAAMGLVLPSEAAAEGEGEQAQEEGGIAGFFQNLFGEGGGDRDELALTFHLFEDDLTRVPNEGETLVRVVHAAPGTEAIDLAVTGQEETVVNDVEFGNASNYTEYAGGVEQLEIRISGSQAATMTLEQLNLQAGNLNTIYVVGTPVEQAPITLLGSSLAPVEAGMPAGEDVAAQGAQTTETAGGGAGEEGQQTEEPATEPAPEQPAPEQPETEQPETEQPATEEPATEEPATEEPATQEPATEEPTTEPQQP